MRVECTFYGPLREAAGHKTLERDLAADATVADLVADLVAEFDDFEESLLGTDGQLGDSVNVTVDGTNVRQLAGEETELADGDIVRFAPPVVGG